VSRSSTPRGKAAGQVGGTGQRTRLAGVALLAYLVGAALPMRAWTGMAYYGGIGLTLLLFPLLEGRARVSVASRQTRLVLALSTAASLAAHGGHRSSSVAALGVNADAGDVEEIQQVREILFVFLVGSVAVAAGAGVYGRAGWPGPSGGWRRPPTVWPPARSSLYPPCGRVEELLQLAHSFDQMQKRLAERTAEREKLLAQVQTSNQQLVLSELREAERAGRQRRLASRLTAVEAVTGRLWQPGSGCSAARLWCACEMRWCGYRHRASRLGGRSAPRALGSSGLEKKRRRRFASLSARVWLAALPAAGRLWCWDDLARWTSWSPIPTPEIRSLIGRATPGGRSGGPGSYTPALHIAGSSSRTTGGSWS